MPKVLTKEEFIIKCKEKHGDIYEYSKVNYINNQTKVEIICKIHGSFYLAPGKHLQGRKCQICSGKNLNTVEFVNRANKKHKNKYDYSLVDYKGIFTDVKIICPKHGIFIQTPDRHLRNNGCSKCGAEICSHKRTYTTSEFIEKSIKVHGNKYDYSISEYIKSKTPLKIICNLHGEFLQTPANHWAGKGCIRCCESKGEREIAKILSAKNIIFEAQKKFELCKNKLCLPFDFYLPDLNMCIEFNGDQHYKSIQYFGGDKAFAQRIENDKLKYEFCKKQNIKLIRIKEGQNISEKLKLL